MLSLHYLLVVETLHSCGFVIRAVLIMRFRHSCGINHAVLNCLNRPESGAQISDFSSFKCFLMNLCKLFDVNNGYLNISHVLSEAFNNCC